VGKGSDHIQLIKFWSSSAPGKGVCGGAKKFLAPPYYSQHAVSASLWALFSCYGCCWCNNFNRFAIRVPAPALCYFLRICCSTVQTRHSVFEVAS